MSGTFTSHTYSFVNLLGRTSCSDFPTKLLIIPPFQRGYSWEKSHVSTFWQDIIQFHESGDDTKPYFLGPIVVLPKPEHNEILDGQQRLATATILLSVIRDMARDYGDNDGTNAGSDFARDVHRDFILTDDSPTSFALTMNDLDKDFFANCIQKEDGDSTKARIRSQRLLKQAHKYLRDVMEEYYEDLDGEDFIKELSNFKKTFVEKIKIVCIEVGSEEEAYQIFETLNDRGLRLSVPDLLLNFLMYSAASKKERDHVKTHWNKIIELMGNRHISVFLRHMWLSEYGDVKSQGLFREIREWIKNNKLSSSEFVENVYSNCELYKAIVELDKSVLCGAYKYVAPLVANLSADKSYPALLSGLKVLDKGDFEKLSKYILSIYIRHSVIGNLNPSELEDTFYSGARTIKQLNANGKNSKYILRKIRDSFASINPTKQRILDSVSDIYLNQKQSNYIVRELANFEQGSPEALKLSEIATLEHIFPQNAQSANWPNHKSLEPYTWHIGNLVYIEKGLNKTCGNKAFSDKKRLYKTSDIKQAQSVTKYSSWNVENIQKRAEDLLSNIDKIWDIPKSS